MTVPIDPLKTPAKKPKEPTAPGVLEPGRRPPIDVGSRIKALRQKRQLSLRDLAALLGCSASFLSRVETNKTSPTLRQLEGVTEALGTTVEDLIGPQSSPVRPMVVRHALKRRTTLGKWNGVTLQNLLPADMVSSFAALVLLLEKDGQSGRIHSRRSVPELAIVLHGSVRFELADSVHNLAQGDCICYDISVPHQWYNLHPGPTEVVLINTNFIPLDEWPEIVEQSANGKTGD